MAILPVQLVETIPSAVATATTVCQMDCANGRMELFGKEPAPTKAVRISPLPLTYRILEKCSRMSFKGNLRRAHISAMTWLIRSYLNVRHRVEPFVVDLIPAAVDNHLVFSH